LRCLGEAGVPVAIATYRLMAANALSRHCGRRFRLPRPERGAEAVVDRLAEIGEELRAASGTAPVLFLLHDWAVGLGAEHRERLARHYLGHFLEPDVLAACNRHDRTCEVAEAAGVAVPATAAVPGDPRNAVAEIPLPAVVKPVSKYTAADGRVWLDPFRRAFGTKARLARTGAECDAFLARCLRAGIPVVVQEFVPGDVSDLVTVVLYADRGRVRGRCASRKIRQGPPRCGTCTYGESCWDADEAFEPARLLVEQLGYTGLAEIEFKRDRRDGRLKLVEINPRATVFCLLAHAHGINLPLMAYRDLAGGSPGPEPAPAHTRPVRWMDPYRDLLESRRSDGRGRVSLGRWFSQMRRSDLLCWGGRGDRLPLWAAPLQGSCEWVEDVLLAPKRPTLGAVKGPAEQGYLDYWRRRAQQDGLRKVMWSNEGYNALVHRRQTELLDRDLGNLAGLRVLDLCCGNGRLAVHLAERGAEVVGLDLPEMTKAAGRDHPHERVTYVAGDARRLDLPPDSFDLVLTVGSLACICHDAAGLDELAGRLHRVLRPGGRLVLLEPLHVCPGIRRPLRMSARAVRKRLGRAGFTSVSRRPLLFLGSWMLLARAWWPGSHGLTAGLFGLGERIVQVPGLGGLSDYKLLVLRKGAG
jgi:predicted ATP-grasp superfamily ATP-dependent carboligase/SAM-dependent methyltransferase